MQLLDLLLEHVYLEMSERVLELVSSRCSIASSKQANPGSVPILIGSGSYWIRAISKNHAGSYGHNLTYVV